MEKLNFDSWMREVDKEIDKRLLCTSEDLPDCLYADWHEQGVSPKIAALLAIIRARE